jgi:hypothetical protein
MEFRGPFDGFVEKAVRATSTCLIMADHNRYSVDARAAGRMVLVRSHAERIVVLFNDAVVAEHPRHFRRDQIIYGSSLFTDLVKKPGACAMAHRSRTGICRPLWPRFRAVEAAYRR